jgi:hypothetical protein
MQLDTVTIASWFCLLLFSCFYGRHARTELIYTTHSGYSPAACGSTVHVRYMSFEVEPCVVWALRVLLPFLAKLIED